MGKPLLHLLLWVLVHSPFQLAGQPLTFRYLGAERGMNSLGSWHATFDQFGFLWVSTSDGLVRYNGHEVNYYYQHTHPELPFDQIGFLMCDNANRVWVCTVKGLTMLDQHRRMTRQTVFPEMPDLGVTACLEDGQGRIYALTSIGAFSRSAEQADWSPQHWLDSLINQRSFDDVRRFDKDRYLIAFPSSGVMLVNVTNQRQEAFIPLPGARCVARWTQDEFLVSASGYFNLWKVSVTTPDRLIKINPPPSFSTSSLHEQIHYMVRAKDDQLYMTTIGAGLWVLDSSLTRYTHYAHDPVNPSTIISNSLRYIVTNNTGHLMVTSLDGVNFTSVFGSEIEYVNYLVDKEKNLLDNRVISVKEDVSGKIWVCMREMVYIYDRDTRIAKPVFIPSSGRRSTERLAPSYVERGNLGDMWVGLRQEGIGIFSADGNFRKLIGQGDHPGHWSSMNQVRVLRSHGEYMYVGTSEGLFRIHQRTFEIDTFAEHSALSAIRHERIVDILPVQEGLWVSSSPGGAAWFYDWGSRTLQTYSTKQGLPSNRIYSLGCDDRGNVFLGSYDGFTHIDSQSSLRVLTKGKGLISPRIESLEVDDEGNVWLTNNYNLLKYTPRTGEVFRMGPGNGMPVVNFAIMGSTKLNSGELIFGANKGFIIVDPGRIDFERDSLDLFVFYRSPDGLESLPRANASLVFQHDEPVIQFVFAVSDVLLEDHVLYRYKLTSGGEGQWSTLSQLNRINFDLSPGGYVLEVEAFDGSHWFTLPDPVLIRVLPPWWRKPGFVIPMILGVIGAGLLILMARLRKYKRDMSIAREFAELESKALRAQMNPHFVFNSLNAIQECIITGKVDEAYTYLSKFSKLLRMVLEQVDLAAISLAEELEMLQLYLELEKLRFRDEFSYHFQLNGDLDPEEINIPPMMIQPHLENAIWHGLRHQVGRKNLEVNIQEKVPGYLHIEVEDNGVGQVAARRIRADRLDSAKKTSRGIRLSEDRIRILQRSYPDASLTVSDMLSDDGTSCGTQVVLELPILPSKLSSIPDLSL